MYFHVGYRLPVIISGGAGHPADEIISILKICLWWTGCARVRKTIPGPDCGDKQIPGKIITHPGAKADIDTGMLARAAAEKGVALEINSATGL